ncbi:RNA polymerase sigma-I factor [Maledivibacter halophilus]|uniref:RNA polymerase sigma factor SigI n=1 Tax=Maledivibacter halophilus TaxID=36842 RepID=A0A1T5MC97_9FIRM|nr:RNA polymerase sigma-I factor [Maledivibacter halophilus]SKC85614.1 RNA polymerase sigma factor [Maledivibacter halophilus]
MGPFLKRFKKKGNNMEEELRKIKAGNDEEREVFIKKYTPFIIKSITKVTKSYIEIENNDEFSIGMEAFNEAIDKYEFKRGSFLGYAETVIRNRIIDYKRKNQSLNNILSIDRENLMEIKVQDKFKSGDFTEKYAMKEQILKLKALLKDFNIGFTELVEESPKHIDTRLNSIYIARSIVENKDIKEDFYRKKMLPAKKIMEKTGVSKKVLKGNRKFIIATALVLDSELELLINYISGVEGRAQNDI